MRLVFLLPLAFFLLSCGNVWANYDQSKSWFYNQDFEGRVRIQLLLIFTGNYVAIVDADFGRRTYEAITSFQRERGFQPDGVLNQIELDQLYAEGGRTMSALGFQFRDEPATGVTFGIPENLFDTVSSTRHGKRWASNDNRVELEILRIPAYETNYKRLFERLTTEKSTRQIEYKLLRNAFFIVSGRNRNKKFYLRMMHTRTDTRGFSLSWDANLSNLMDRVAVAMSNSLTAFDDSRTARADPDDISRPSPSQPKVPESKQVPSGIAYGSGYFISRHGHIGTNAHVAGNCRSLEVAEHGPAQLIKSDEQNDLAIIQLVSKTAEHIAEFRSLPVKRGENVIVMGFPFAKILADNLTVSQGIVSSLAGIGGDVRHFQISAPVQPGNSGGPVLDETGALIGTIVARLDALKTLELAGALPENVNFAIRGHMMAALMASLNIEPYYADSTEPKSVAAISSEAERYTVQVICRN